MYKTYVQSSLKKNRLIRWPENCFPVKVYIAPFRWYKAVNKAYDYISLVKEALTIWANVSNGLVSFTLVNSLMESQININWKRVDRNALGYCHYSYDKLGRLFSAEVEIGLSDGVIHKKYMNKDEVFHTILHEIGHALGLGHSPNPDDIMYTPHKYGVVGLSRGDILTLNWLYKFRNGITLDEAIQEYRVNVSSFDELIFKIDDINYPKSIKNTQEKKINTPSKEDQEALLIEHQKIGEIKKYVLGLQNIQISSDVNSYIKKNIRNKWPFDNRK